MSKGLIKDYRNSDEYKLLVEDSQGILTEGIFRSRQELIDTYRELGKRIYNDPLYTKWSQKTQGKFMRGLAEDIGNSIQVLYYSIQFYERLTTDLEFSTAVEKLGKNASWTKIRALLPEPKKENQIPLPKGKYEIIYADPAWEYSSEQHGKAGEPLTGGAITHYNQVMSDEELCQLKVKDISADDCILFMWVTGPKLESATIIGKEWGFEYSTVGFVWYKELPNPGTYTMSECEYCLIFRKGNVPQPRGDRNVRQFLSERRTEHSRKPKEIRRRIEMMFPCQKKVELFARNKSKGWDCWGDEV